MPLNPNIPLQAAGAVPNLGQSLALFNQAQQQKAQSERQAQLDPLRQQLLESQVEGSQLQNQALTQQQELQSIIEGAKGIKPFLDSGNIEGAKQFLSNRVQGIQARGGNPGDSLELMKALDAGDLGLANNLVDSALAVGQKSGAFQKGAASVTRIGDKTFTVTPVFDPQTGEVENVLTEIEGELLTRQGETPLESSKRKVKEAGDKKAAELRSQAEGSREVEKEKAVGKNIVTRAGQDIEKGLQAADGHATIKRSLELLDSIKTGGFSGAAIKAKQFFGVEGADEGELSFNLGKNVLGQLKATFGAAFTVKEGEQLERLEAGIGKSPAANRRILQNALQLSKRASKRGIAAAIKLEDYQQAAEIQKAMDFVLEPPKEEVGEQVKEQAPGVQTIGRFQIEEL